MCNVLKVKKKFGTFFSLKLFWNFSFKIDSITLDPDLDPDPDPNWAKILDPDPDPNSIYLDPQHWCNLSLAMDHWLIGGTLVIKLNYRDANDDDEWWCRRRATTSRGMRRVSSRCSARTVTSPSSGTSSSPTPTTCSPSSPTMCPPTWR